MIYNKLICNFFIFATANERHYDVTHCIFGFFGNFFMIKFYIFSFVPKNIKCIYFDTFANIFPLKY